jgi:hypothetical protein
MKLFAAITFLVALATASPVANVTARDERLLAKRDTEVIYLSNCRNVVSCCPPLAEKHFSRIFVSPSPTSQQKAEDTATDSPPSFVPIVLPRQRSVPQRRTARGQRPVQRQHRQLHHLGAGQPAMHLPDVCRLHGTHRLGCPDSPALFVGRVCFPCLCLFHFLLSPAPSFHPPIPFLPIAGTTRDKVH